MLADLNLKAWSAWAIPVLYAVPIEVVLECILNALIMALLKLIAYYLKWKHGG